jgi:D-alanyl-D-alanine carboxypeptidase
MTGEVDLAIVEEANNMIKKFLFFLLLGILSNNIYADLSSIPKMLNKYSQAQQEEVSQAQLKSTIEKFASEYGKSHQVNFVFLVSKNDEIISEGKSIFASKKAYKNPVKQLEYANETLLDFDSSIPIASATKLFTAAAILKLQEEGKLNIYDAISKYLSKYGKSEKWADEVTLHHLLSQSSGIAEYQTQLYLDLNKSEEEIKTTLIKFIYQKGLKYKPGEKFDYSNTNYALLGLIIEEVSGKSLSEFFAENIFTPLGMKYTYFASLQEARDYESGKLKTKYPKRYFLAPGEEPINFLPLKINRMLPPLGDGGIISTIHDLSIWVHALHGGKVISQESLKIMRTPYFESNYRKYKMKAKYGYAMHIQELNDETIYSHGCDALGLRGEYSYLKSKKIAIISTSNFTLAIQKNLEYNEEEIHNMYKIDLRHFHGDLLKKILDSK